MSNKAAEQPRTTPDEPLLRAAAQAVVDAIANWHLPTTVGGPRLSDALIALRAALASAGSVPAPLDVDRDIADDGYCTHSLCDYQGTFHPGHDTP